MPDTAAMANADSIAAVPEESGNQDVIQYSDMLGGHSISVYPNLTHGRLNIRISGMVAGINGDISVYDTQNKLLLKIPCTNEFTLVDLSSYPAGAYLMYIRIEDKISHWKIIKD